MNPKELFIIILFLIIWLLLVHHRWKHRKEFKRHPKRRWFQWQDVNNHETVELLILGIIIGLLISNIL